MSSISRVLFASLLYGIFTVRAYNVTFEVKADNVDVTDAIYLGGGAVGDANAVKLSLDTDGTWTGSFDLTSSDSYVFLNSPTYASDWGKKEDLSDLDCGKGQYNDRQIPPINGATTIQACFGSCESDGTCPDITGMCTGNTNDSSDIVCPANKRNRGSSTEGNTETDCCYPVWEVTFSLDMTGQELDTDSIPTVPGTFNSWHTYSLVAGMSPTQEDNNIWTYTVELPDGDYEYKYSIDLWISQEVVPEECSTSHANRYFNVNGANIHLPTTRWSSCFSVSKPDSSKWHMQTQCITQNTCWANGEEQHYTDRHENAYVSGGHLHIVAKKGEYVSENITKDYTSARLNSKYDFQYGTVKVRAKLPKRRGLWPAIWTLGSNIDQKGHDFGRSSEEVAWPTCGEIDIMEQYGTQNFVGSAMHGPSYDVITDAAGGNAIPWNTVGLSPTVDEFHAVDEFHVYSANWSETGIIFKVDEFPYKTVTAPQDKTDWPFDHKHFLLLNVAVEQGRTGTIDANIEEGETVGKMVVDYVRIYDTDNTLVWFDEFDGSEPNEDFLSKLDCSGMKIAYIDNCQCTVST